MYPTYPAVSPYCHSEFLVHPHHDAGSLIDARPLRNGINHRFSIAVHLDGPLKSGRNHHICMVQKCLEHSRENASGHFLLSSLGLAGFLVMQLPRGDPRVDLGFIMILCAGIRQLLHIFLPNQFKEGLQDLAPGHPRGCPRYPKIA